MLKESKRKKKEKKKKLHFDERLHRDDADIACIPETHLTETFRFTVRGYQTFREEQEIVRCLTSQQHASVSQGRICTDNFTCCHTEIQSCRFNFPSHPSQYTDTGPASHSTDPITPGAWQGKHSTSEKSRRK